MNNSRDIRVLSDRRASMNRLLRELTAMSDRAELDRRTFLKLAAAAGLVSGCRVSALDAATECAVNGKRIAKQEDGDIGDMRYPLSVGIVNAVFGQGK